MKKRGYPKKSLPKPSLFQQSLQLLKKNKVLFIPHLLMILTNVLLFTLLVWFSGLVQSFLANDYSLFKEILFSPTFLICFLVYLVFSLFIDNFFFATKYGMIKDVVLKKKTTLQSGFRFAKKFYWTTLGIHILAYLIIFVPLFLLVFFLFSIFPPHSLVAFAVFLPLVVVWLFYITLRLLFVYPVMAFEKKGAYASLTEDFHFVKTHFHHTFLTWLIIILVLIIYSIFRANLKQLTILLSQQILLLAVLTAAIILTIDLLVSVWEHVFIFKSYLEGKKKK